jgi:zinc protease
VITQTEVDGVPTLYVPSSGPVSAGLVFRIGYADETLARAGVTHLVEHLALHRHGVTDYHHDATTDAVFTRFHLRGSADHVVAYLAGVCSGLAELPLDRLETEKGILRTEAANRSRPALPVWRYGATGYGLAGYPEWGLHRLGPDDVYEWARTWFTRDNAVLWVCGTDLPAGLRLSLPSGTRRPLPTASSALPATPAYFVGGESSIVLDAVVSRGLPAAVFAGVLEREMYRSLRQEGGYSYTAAASYRPRDDRFATVTAVADALPAQRQAALGGLVDTLQAMLAGRIDDADVAAVRGAALDGLSEAGVDADWLASCAADLLNGVPYQSVEDLQTGLAAVTAADVHAVAVEAWRSLLVQVPWGTRAGSTGFAAAPTHSTYAVAGTRHRARGAERATLIVGADGVSLLTGDGPITVRYEQCVAELQWPDGGRQIIGIDGMSVRVEPTLFRIGPATVAAVDSRVPPAVVIPMPARDPLDRPRAAAGGVATPRQKALLVVLGVIATSLATCNGLATWAFGTDPTTMTEDWVLVALVWTVVAAMVAAIWVITRRIRQRR